MPALVQPAAKNSGTGTSLTVTLANPTSAGSCLLVLVLTTANTNGAVSGITLGGSADNFGAVASEGSSGDHAIVTCWADPSCASGQTSVAITTTGSSGTQAVSAVVYELSGMPATLAGMLDKSAVFTSSGFATTWTLGPTATTTQASEVWLSIVGGNVSAVTAGAYTGPGGSWTDTALTGVNNYSGGFSAGGVSGFQVVSSAAAASYNGTASPASTMDGLVVTLKAAAAAAAAAPPPQIPPGFLSPAAFTAFQAVPQGGALISDSDAGAGADTGSAAAAVSDSDTGTGADAGSAAAALAGADTGTGADAESVAVAVTGADTGTGTDDSSAAAPAPAAPPYLIPPGFSSPMAFTAFQAVPQGGALAGDSDAAAAADAGAVAVAVTGADTGSGADAGSIAAAVPDADTGTAADSGTAAAAVSDADTGTAADSGSAVTPLSFTPPPQIPPGFLSPAAFTAFQLPSQGSASIAAADTGSAADTGTAAVAVTGADTAAAADAGSAAAAATGSDAGTGADAGAVAVAVTGADTGTGADAGTVPGSGASRAAFLVFFP